MKHRGERSRKLLAVITSMTMQILQGHSDGHAGGGREVKGK